MKKNDIEELEDEIIDDEVIDDEAIEDEFDDFEEIDDEPVQKGKKPAKAAKKASGKKKMKKGAKVAIISSSAAVGVIAIALVVIFAILPLAGIDLLGKAGSKGLYYKPDSTYGLFFYGDNHKVLNGGSDADIDMVRASKDMSTSYFDPSKPTIVWTHGWEPTGSFGDAYLCAGADTRKVVTTYDVSYVEELKKKGYNVATFQFQGFANNSTNYATNLNGPNSIYKYTMVKMKGAKHSMSYMFASELATILGEKYAQDVTLVGHSCGAFVSTATAYMLQTFYQKGMISNKHLVPSRLILEDPYVDGDENTDLDEGAKMDGTDEDVVSRTKCQVVLNMIASLGKDSNTAIDVYLGMGGASSTFVQDKKFMKDADVHTEDFEKALEYCTVVDMTGMKQWQDIIGNIHVLTRDWVWASMLGDKLKDENGNLAPSAACTNEEIISMRGKLYQQSYKGFIWNKSNKTLEVIKTATSTSTFLYAEIKN